MNQQISGPTAGEPTASPALHSAAEAATEHSGLDDVAALLAEQLSACHAAAARCFAIANDDEDFEMGARLDALKLAARLVQASAVAASAVKRVKGGQFHHHVTVHRIDYGAEKAARKAREKAAKGESPEAKRQRLLEKILRFAREDAGDEPEDQATCTGTDTHADSQPASNIDDNNSATEGRAG
jgi:hypothetical protein